MTLLTTNARLHRTLGCARRHLTGLLAIAAWLIAAAPALAHEFWIAPSVFHPAPGDAVEASLRVGTMMKGEQLPFIAETFESFTKTRHGMTADVTGRDGDMPALRIEQIEPGLTVIAYHALANEVTYDDWIVFQRYLELEGLTPIADLHRARGLPDTGFSESYRRYAKALVQAGPVGPEDRDMSVGAPLEIVALENPYSPGLEALDVRLLRDGAPVAGRQIAVFRYDGEVVRRTVRTDREGRARIKIAGGGSFLLNATDIQPVEDGKVVWASYWASLTFGLPIVDPPPHPLDPLTKTEIAEAVRAIGRSGRATATTRVALLTLDEPAKEEVLSWRSGDPVRRRAFAVLRQDGETVETEVDIAPGGGAVASWTPRPGAQPAIQSAEWALAQRLTKEDPRWLAAMAARGYENPNKIFCESLSVGRFGGEGESDAEGPPPRRLKTICYDISEAVTNVYARPIEGVTTLVDLDAERVDAVVDTGVVPVAGEAADFDPASVPDAPAAPWPAGIKAPAERNVALDGRQVAWGPWRFHLGFDQRFGPVLSLVTHGAEAPRSVLYQGHLSEIFVPYMDGGESWYFRAYMDAGEFGVGASLSSLVAGSDCPAEALFVDAVTVTRLGAPQTRLNAICVFERLASSPLWRHSEALGGTHETRPATELVVRSAATVGNYDYFIDWIFTLAGEIVVEVGATGIDAVKGVAVRAMTDEDAEEDAATGMLVAPNLVAVHHDHYFSFRLDMDIDGPVNAFRRDRLAPIAAPEGSPRRGLWRLFPDDETQERAVSMKSGPELWRVEDPGRRTALGHHPAYQIAVDSDAVSLLPPDDATQARAAFSGETLWITRRRDGERFAAGEYPNQSEGGEGLPRYMDGETVVDEDVVVWATLGFHHLTRPEDWPVLPTVRHRLRLRPYGFFTRNPGLGAPPSIGD